MNKVKFKRYIIILASVLLLTINVSAQESKSKTKVNQVLDTKKIFPYDYTLGIGISTAKILNPNPNSRSMNPLVHRDGYIGGSFKGAMPGIDLRATFQLDEDGFWRLPVGVDMTFYSAKERLPITTKLTDRFENNASIYAPYIGLNYTLVQIPKARASFYLGVEARASIIDGPAFRFIRTYDLIPEQSFDITEYNKENTVRLGGMLKLGLEGELIDNYMINSSIGYGVLNTFMRDNARGELLTPRKDFETKESYLQGMFFTIMLQYRFNK